MAQDHTCAWAYVHEGESPRPSRSVASCLKMGSEPRNQGPTIREADCRSVAISNSSDAIPCQKHALPHRIGRDSSMDFVKSRLSGSKLLLPRSSPDLRRDDQQGRVVGMHRVKQATTTHRALGPCNCLDGHESGIISSLYEQMSRSR
jgi:hypothetical protein